MPYLLKGTTAAEENMIHSLSPPKNVPWKVQGFDMETFKLQAFLIYSKIDFRTVYIKQKQCEYHLKLLLKLKLR